MLNAVLSSALARSRTRSKGSMGGQVIPGFPCPTFAGVVADPRLGIIWRLHSALSHAACARAVYRCIHRRSTYALYALLVVRGLARDGGGEESAIGLRAA